MQSSYLYSRCKGLAQKAKLVTARDGSRLDFRLSLESCSGDERGLLSRTAAGNRAYDLSRRPVTVCQFAECRWYSVVLYTISTACGVLILERGTFHVYLCCWRVVATRHEPSSLLTPLYGSGLLDMYVECSQNMCLLQVINRGVEEHVNITGYGYDRTHMPATIPVNLWNAPNRRADIVLWKFRGLSTNQ